MFVDNYTFKQVRMKHITAKKLILIKKQSVKAVDTMIIYLVLPCAYKRLLRGFMAIFLFINLDYCILQYIIMFVYVLFKKKHVKIDDCSYNPTLPVHTNKVLNLNNC